MTGIVAMSEDRVIGRDGQLPWHLPEDLKFFKRTTLGHVILMGRKTYDSIGRPLPGRESWVLTRGGEIPGVKTIGSVSEIREPEDGRKLFVIGGAQLFRELLPQCDEVYLTKVRRTVPDGDVFMPPFEADFPVQEVIQSDADMEIILLRKQAV